METGWIVLQKQTKGRGGWRGDPWRAKGAERLRSTPTGTLDPGDPTPIQEEKPLQKEIQTLSLSLYAAVSLLEEGGEKLVSSSGC